MQIEPGLALSHEVRELAEAWPYRPYSYLPSTTAGSQSAYLVATLQQAQQNGARIYFRRAGSQLEALMQLDLLPWDTQVLGFPVARIGCWIDRLDDAGNLEHREGLLTNVVDEARHLGVRYLFTRAPAADVCAIHALEGNGFRLVDGLLTFGVDTRKEPAREETTQDLSCGIFAPGDLPALRKIAADSFSIGRFHGDPAIGRKKAEEVYRRWTENSCAGYADCVLVVRATEAVGFVALKIDRCSKPHLGLSVGVITLVATSHEHRRKGVARRLTIAARNWFRDAGCDWVEVGTQVANIDACRLYQNAGFELVGSSLTFRRLL